MSRLHQQASKHLESEDVQLSVPPLISELREHYSESDLGRQAQLPTLLCSCDAWWD